MKKLNPWNIWLINMDKYVKENFIKEITSPMMYEPSTKSFHPGGLYSEEIFGQVGTPARIGTLGYIDLNCTVLAPLIYLNVITVESWYKDLMESRVYAKWSAKEGDFIPSDKNDPEAKTGYAYFMSHFADIKWRKNKSKSRDNKIGTIEKSIKEGTWWWTKMLVTPAGWRDAKVDRSGKVEVDAVNKLYTSLLVMSREVRSSLVTPELIPFFDGAKYHIQLKCVEIFTYWKTFFEGKTGFAQGKYVKRNLAGGTRNVISSATMLCDSPSDTKMLKHNDTQLPLYQTAKAFEPAVVHALNMLFTSTVYTLGSVQIPAIDPKTLDLVYVEVSPTEVTYALDSKSKHDFINDFKNISTRHDPVMVTDINGKNYWLWMVYDLEDTIYLFRGIHELEAMLNKTPTVNTEDTYGVFETAEVFANEGMELLVYTNNTLVIWTDGNNELFNDMKYHISNAYPDAEIKVNLIDVKPFDINDSRNALSKIAKAYGWDSIFVMTPGASITKNNNDSAVADLRTLLKNYEYEHGDNPNEDWSELVENNDKQPEEDRRPSNSIVVDRSKVRPLTKVEMLYIATMAIKDKIVTCTRFPATKMGSIYPSNVVVVTTTPDRVVKYKSQHDPSLVIEYPHYPIHGRNQYIDSAIIHPSKTIQLNGDYDGDKMSFNGILTEEAKKEAIDHLNSAASLISPSTSFYDSINTAAVNYVLHAVTRVQNEDLGKIEGDVYPDFAKQ